MYDGQLIAVVGPSGAGKDSILALVKAAMPDLVFVQRVITRPKDNGFEDHVPVSEDQFKSMSAEGAFLFEWQANGLFYGIPSSVSDDLGAGRRVVFNGSRGALPAIAEGFPELLVISIEADPDVLRERLMSRGRETQEEIDARLTRKVPSLPSHIRVETVNNSGKLEDAVAQMIDALSRQRRDGTGA